MIARFLPLFILLILLPDFYLYRQLVARRTQSVPLRVAWWIPTVVLTIYTIILFFSTNFIPENPRLLNFYLLVLGVFTLPKVLLAISLWVGEWIGKKRHWRHHYALPVGMVLGLIPAWSTVYGSFFGFQELEVNRVDCYFDDLPKGFDGYRIALFSDAHVGSYTGGDSLVLERAVDSLLAMKADAIFFLGDLQNIGPWEIKEKATLLSRLTAPDGVYSILGNHDYSAYQGGGFRRKLAQEKQTEQAERELGWQLLLNENTVLRHNGDSIMLCGMEGNEKKGADHGIGLIHKALEGVGDNHFAILLAHNPKIWRKYALPLSTAQLTLSGHTHGGQMGIFGVTTTSPFYSENGGLYEEGNRKLFVTKGVGALIPMRFNVPGEVVLLTLHRQTNPPRQSTYSDITQ